MEGGKWECAECENRFAVFGTKDRRRSVMKGEGKAWTNVPGENPCERYDRMHQISILANVPSSSVLTRSIHLYALSEPLVFSRISEPLFIALESNTESFLIISTIPSSLL